MKEKGGKKKIPLRGCSGQKQRCQSFKNLLAEELRLPKHWKITGGGMREANLLICFPAGAGEARPNRGCCKGSARLFSYFLSYVKMQNFAQHPGRGVSWSSVRFHFENIRGSPAQVVKHHPVFPRALYVGACGDAAGSDRCPKPPGGVGCWGSNRGPLCWRGGGTCSKAPVLPGHLCSVPRGSCLPCTTRTYHPQTAPKMLC